MSEHTLTLTLQAEDRDPGQGGAVWVRLEPAAARGDVATVADAARVIDELFQIEPCAGGLGTGGLEVEIGPAGSIEPPVDEPEFDQVTQTTLGIGVCQASASGWSWEGMVRVLRSHVDYPYVLRVDQGEVIATERVDEIVETAVLFDNANTASMELPAAGEVEGWWGSVVTRSGVEPFWRISGATINLDRRATGQLNLRYRTVHDLVTVRVGGRAGAEQLQQALCLCFYRSLVADCSLEPPEIDDRDLARLQCHSTGRLEDGEPGECYETVTTRTRCSCSGEVWDESTHEESVPCPEGAGPGRRFLGSRTMTSRTICPGERDEALFDPETQQALCCGPAGNVWPCVRQVFDLPGGRGVDGGVDFYQALYGPRTRLVGLTPPEGNCGQLIVEVKRIARNCCDLALPVRLPGEMVAAPDTEIIIEAESGVDPYDWQGEGGLILEGTSEGTRRAHFRTAEDFCGTGFVRVEDACEATATMPVRSTEGQWEAQDVTTDPCMALEGFAPGAVDTDSGGGLCDGVAVDLIRTSGEWLVNVGISSVGFALSCPEIPPGCGRRYITMVPGWGYAPDDAACFRYGCTGVVTQGGGACCVLSSSAAPMYAVMYQRLLSAYRWVCA